MAHELRIGDRVVVASPNFEGIPLQGRRGTIIAKHDYFCVLFDQSFFGGHDELIMGDASGVPLEIRLGRCRHGWAHELRYIGMRVNINKLV